MLNIYTFSPASPDTQMYLQIPFCMLDLGSRNGLSLILNVEQYEYMTGPQDDAGVKVSHSDLSYFHRYIKSELYVKFTHMTNIKPN